MYCQLILTSPKLYFVQIMQFAEREFSVTGVLHCSLSPALFFKWAIPGLFFVYFCLLLQFLQQKMWKMSIQYTVLGFEPTTFGTWVSSHNQGFRPSPELFPPSIPSTFFDLWSSFFDESSFNWKRSSVRKCCRSQQKNCSKSRKIENNRFQISGDRSTDVLLLPRWLKNSVTKTNMSNKSL